jgi:hypothetical protein
MNTYMYLYIHAYVHICIHTYVTIAIVAQVPDVRAHDEQLHQLGARAREPHALGGLAPLCEVRAYARLPVACRTRSLRLAASPRTRVSVRDIVSRTAWWPAGPAQAVYGAMRVSRPTASRVRPPACLPAYLFVCLQHLVQRKHVRARAVVVPQAAGGAPPSRHGVMAHPMACPLGRIVSRVQWGWACRQAGHHHAGVCVCVGGEGGCSTVFGRGGPALHRD